MSNTLRDLQLAELELLKIFLRICKKHHLRYYALGGTLLGAVRHQGFIPWDDDIDLGMPRPDFIRFEQIVEQELPEGVRYHDWKRDPDYRFYVPRMTDSRVKVIDRASSVALEKEAWIDIFPLDGMPNDAAARRLHADRLLAARMRVNYSMFSTNVDIRRKRPLPEQVLVFAGKVLPVEKLFDTRKELQKLDRLMQKYPYDTSSWMINFMGIHKLKEMFHRKRYGKGAWYPFEDVRLRGPEDYDFVLTQMYGDYMSPPEESARNHHSTQMAEENGESRTFSVSDTSENADGIREGYSVLMSVYAKEKPENLRLAIRSMQMQTLPYSEFVLVCDGPLTPELEDVIGEAKKASHGDFKCVRLPENRGVGRALHTGILSCSCPVIARMDSDDISRPDRCRLEMEKIREGYSLVGGSVREFNETPGDLSRERTLPLSDREIRDFAGKRNPFNHGTVMFRKDCVLAAGNYRDFPGFEDYFLWVRILQQDVKVCNLPEVLVDMRIGNGLSARRGGPEYVRSMLRFQNYLKENHIITPAAWLANCTVRTAVGMGPPGVREQFYGRFLRK